MSIYFINDFEKDENFEISYDEEFDLMQVFDKKTKVTISFCPKFIERGIFASGIKEFIRESFTTKYQMIKKRYDYKTSL